MAQTVLPIGVATTLIQNRSYALPPKLCFVQSLGAIEHSFDESAWWALSSGSTTGLRFLRSTVAGNIVTVADAGKQAQGWNTQQIKASDYIAVGSPTAQSGAIRIANNAEIKARNTANTADIRLIATNGDLVYMGDGAAGLVLNHPYVLFASYMAFIEGSNPPVPSVNRANMWLQDNGSGKTQLMIQFNTGAPIAIATQA